MSLIKQSTKIISATALCLSVLLANDKSHAQLSYPYTANFETATTTPASKSYDSTDPISLNGVSWVMPGLYLGTMNDNDKRLDDKCGRLRLTSNATGDPGSIYTVEDFTAGVGTFSFYAADYGTEDGSTLTVQYSTDAGATWTTVSTLSSTDITGELQEFSFDINQPGNVRLKLLKDAANARVNLDNFTVTVFEDPTIITLVSKSPVGTDVSLETNTLTLTYNHPIVAATGTITVTNAATPSETQTFTVPDDVTIDGETATVSGLSLENFTSYYVTMTAGTFAKASDETIVNNAITSITDWTFTTVDETPFTEINESFTTCLSGDVTSVFTTYNTTGSQVWDCTTFGRLDEKAIRINGGFAADSSHVNEDWLITKRPINVTSITSPVLQFWMKRRFDGPIDFKVKVSTDYTGVGDPAAATWTDLTSITSVSDEWAQSAALSLSTMTGNFYLAFVYTCGTTGAIELSLDDIVISGATSVDVLDQENHNITVIGNSTTDEINLHLNTSQAGQYTFQIIDLNGRVINTISREIHAGNNEVKLAPLNLTQGLYIIKAINSNGSYIQPVKAIVR